MSLLMLWIPYQSLEGNALQIRLTSRPEGVFCFCLPWFSLFHCYFVLYMQFNVWVGLVCGIVSDFRIKQHIGLGGIFVSSAPMIPELMLEFKSKALKITAVGEQRW